MLTFDDSVASHATFVGPLLQEYGFGATFFITEGFEFIAGKEHYMTWEQIQELDRAGFEIGNHNRRHATVTKQKRDRLEADIAYIASQSDATASPGPSPSATPALRPATRPRKSSASVATATPALGTARLSTPKSTITSAFLKPSTASPTASSSNSRTPSPRPATARSPS